MNISTKVTTPFGDDVVVHTFQRFEGVYISTMSGGPHDACRLGEGEYKTYSEKAALQEHDAWVKRHKTGYYDCEECDGEGTAHCFSDRAVWGPGGLSGHTTDEWTERCEHCVDGVCFDEDIGPLPDDHC